MIQYCDPDNAIVLQNFYQVTNSYNQNEVEKQFYYEAQFFEPGQFYIILFTK